MSYSVFLLLHSAFFRLALQVRSTTGFLVISFFFSLVFSDFVVGVSVSYLTYLPDLPLVVPNFKLSPFAASDIGSSWFSWSNHFNLCRPTYLEIRNVLTVFVIFSFLDDEVFKPMNYCAMHLKQILRYIFLDSNRCKPKHYFNKSFIYCQPRFKRVDVFVIPQ
jgi:hypothetical protein